MTKKPYTNAQAGHERDRQAAESQHAIAGAYSPKWLARYLAWRAKRRARK